MKNWLIKKLGGYTQNEFDMYFKNLPRWSADAYSFRVMQQILFDAGINESVVAQPDAMITFIEYLVKKPTICDMCRKSLLSPMPGIKQPFRDS